ncbi:hypothetical protein PRIPAC_91062 [Pristionchus pacificus]|uniref:Uncharacterized protein n=1 Tax=Pristionchus pacificus TaxID=54126 RepID=A0A8R1U5Q1_PRIPA|nr:hypothetical protein PRIPAC_91062 [Pristionchus pacificus]|eukprot:PDM61774.1 hypothetical protein PRIPAC_51216 [Pristionchus pacificus]
MEKGRGCSSPTEMLTVKMLAYNILLLMSTASTVAVASTCYAPVTSAQHFQLHAHYAVVNQTACAGFCDLNSECTGYSYQPTPLENKCALLGAVIPSEVCLVPKQIFQQQKTNVNCNFCPLPVNVHPDSCIDSVVGALEKGSMICPRIKDGQASFYIIRATLPNGTLMTLENDQSAQLVCTNDEWMYSFNFYNIFTVPLVTASCVLAGPTKCPCAPLNQTAGTTSAVTVDRINPCPANMYMKFWYTNMNNTHYANLEETEKSIIRCMAGEWFTFQTVSGNTWRVASAGCM